MCHCESCRHETIARGLPSLLSLTSWDMFAPKKKVWSEKVSRWLPEILWEADLATFCRCSVLTVLSARKRAGQPPVCIVGSFHEIPWNPMKSHEIRATKDECLPHLDLPLLFSGRGSFFFLNFKDIAGGSEMMGSLAVETCEWLVDWLQLRDPKGPCRNLYTSWKLLKARWFHVISMWSDIAN